jgi:ubiquinone/menaquinone biosynthesis C-methylase UbiE
MPPTDQRQSEKEYLSRAGTEEWELSKPFSPPGSFSIDESAEMILDFAVAILNLKPDAQDRFLDLGAGSCWVSEWLHRLNLKSVALDLSLEMLRIGKRRFHESDSFIAAAGDMEKLPFQSDTFDKAICLNAIHHLPGIPNALKEVARVLKQDGVALFSEPGKGHAEDPQSQAAIRDFGVLEQDVQVVPFMDQCYAAGFREVRIKPISYVIPEFDLSREEWLRLEKFWLRKRPLRALQKMGRAALEFFGAAKKSLLLEEVFAVQLIRLLKQPVEHHPIVVAYKSFPADQKIQAVRATIKLLEAPPKARSGEEVSIQLNIRNSGSVIWKETSQSESGYVRLGIQLLDGTQKLLKRDYFRIALPAPMRPGEKWGPLIRVPVPDSSGNYFFKFDMVLEGITWFEPAGSRPIYHAFEVVK